MNWIYLILFCLLAWAFVGPWFLIVLVALIAYNLVRYADGDHDDRRSKRHDDSDGG